MCKAAKAKPKHFLSIFFAAPPCAPRRFFKDKEIFGFDLRPTGTRGALSLLHHAVRSYDLGAQAITLSACA